jgi:RecB family endonuclease NucS
MSLIENYYFQLKTAIINGEAEKVRMYLAFLGGCSINELKENLHPDWYASYLRIQLNSSQNILVDMPPVEDIQAYDFELGKEPTISQRDLVEKIIWTPQRLLDILDIRDLDLIEAEYPTYREEKVDLVVRDRKTIIYPIEIKVGRATHETIGQIRKYASFFWKHLYYKSFYKVQGVVLAGSYDITTMRELKRESNIILSYRLVDKLVLFERL